jgi:hypothetical protein
MDDEDQILLRSRRRNALARGPIDELLLLVEVKSARSIKLRCCQAVFALSIESADDTAFQPQKPPNLNTRFFFFFREENCVSSDWSSGSLTYAARACCLCRALSRSTGACKPHRRGAAPLLISMSQRPIIASATPAQRPNLPCLETCRMVLLCVCRVNFSLRRPSKSNCVPLRDHGTRCWPRVRVLSVTV